MTFIPLDANLRPFGAQTPHTEGLRYENTASPHSSFRAKARNLFRSWEGKGCERNGKREAPYSLRPPKTVFHADRSTQEKERGKRKRSLGCARDDDTRIPLPARFSSRCDANLRPFGAPPSMGRRENAASRAPHEDGFRYENAASPHSSFRAKARNLFRSRQGKGCERSGKRETPCSLRPQKRYFMQTVPRRKENTANEKDPSAALGITIREYYLLKKGGEAATRALNLEP